MRDSEVGNKDLLKAMAALLNVLDPKQFASMLATDRIIPTVSVASPIASPLFRYDGFSDNQGMEGLATYAVPIVSCGENEIARVLALEVGISSPNNVSGSITMSGHLSLEETGCQVFNFVGIGAMAGEDPWEARLAKGGFIRSIDGAYRAIIWEGLVPPNKSFIFQIDSTANFPALTQLTIRAIYTIGPAPFQPPM